jgi:hypothetical protein
LESSDNLKDIFSQIEDHRSHINQLHNLIDILLIGIISVICGAETWEQMVRFATSKEDFLNKFLELPNGIPSKVGLMDKMVGLFTLYFSCGQNGWSFFW